MKVCEGMEMSEGVGNEKKVKGWAVMIRIITNWEVSLFNMKQSIRR